MNACHRVVGLHMSNITMENYFCHAIEFSDASIELLRFLLQYHMRYFKNKKNTCFLHQCITMNKQFSAPLMNCVEIMIYLLLFTTYTALCLFVHLFMYMYDLALYWLLARAEIYAMK